MFFRHGLSRKDAILILLGASSMHLYTLLFASPVPAERPIVIHNQIPHAVDRIATFTKELVFTRQVTKTVHHLDSNVVTSTVPSKPTPIIQSVPPSGPLPQTSLLAHSPGWTLFRNLYMSNGTLFIIADAKTRERFPEIRLMTSTGLAAENTPENIALREPTAENMAFITPEEAQRRWGASTGGMNRVWTVEGNTLLFNDPPQFLRHYYHFVAELLFGVQAFWHGAFSKPVELPSHPAHFSLVHPAPPPIHRAIFAHSNADGWRDDPGFNTYFLRAVLPSLTVEHADDWYDRIEITTPRPGMKETDQRAWHFPLVLLTDRSAAHRGPICGSQTQRTAAEAWDGMRRKGKLMGIHVGAWWAPLREAMWRFAGAKEGMGPNALANVEEVARYRGIQALEVPQVVGMDKMLDQDSVVEVDDAAQKRLPLPEKIVINYISRQTTRHRKLITADHEGMVASLHSLVVRKNKEREEIMKASNNGRVKSQAIPVEWEFNEVAAERLSHDQQIQQAARTTFMLGVHGNGLTHLVWMKPTRYSTVIELFYPKGFAHDYQWTSRALGMKHYAVWNDTHHTYPHKPEVDYPEGFQGNEIPVYGPGIAQLIEDRIAGKA